MLKPSLESYIRAYQFVVDTLFPFGDKHFLLNVKMFNLTAICVLLLNFQL